MRNIVVRILRSVRQRSEACGYGNAIGNTTVVTVVVVVVAVVSVVLAAE